MAAVVERVRTDWARMLIGLGLAAPVPVFVVLMTRPALDVTAGSPASHFYVVSAVAFLSLVLAGAVLWAGRTLPDPRTFFLAMAFVSMATIFLAHGLGTSPLFQQHALHEAAEYADQEADEYGATATSGYGVTVPPATGTSDHVAAHTADAPVTLSPEALAVIVARGKVVGYSARLSMLVSALFFALAVLDFGPRISAFILRHRTPLTVGLTAVLAGHVFLALAHPTLLIWLPITSGLLSWVIAGVAWAALAFAGWRFLQAYRLAMLPLQGAMATGVALLAQAQVFMILGRLWHISWWEYHVVMFAGFSLCVGALLAQYRITGDLGAVVEGLFLRRQISGIRAGDPRALEALGAAVAAKDSETAEHLERVGELSVAIARRIGLPEANMDNLRWAGRLHDVGKIGVPNSILRKPGALTPEEFEVVKRHTVRGGRVIERSGLLSATAPIVRAHHERIDGGGYPDGLRGDEIPIEARVVAVADVWDALTWDRPYRAALTTAEATEIMVRSAGSHLDAGCVNALFIELGLTPLSTAAA